MYKNNENKLSDTIINCVSCFIIMLFIFSDFARLALAGMYTIYNFFVPLISILSLLICIFNFKKYDYIQKMLVIFVIFITAIELYHSNFNNILNISENICWVIAALNFSLTKNKKHINMILIIYLTLNAVLSIPSVLIHFINLPILTQPGIIGVDDPGLYGQRNINGMINVMSFMIAIFLLRKVNNRYIKLYIIVLQIFSFTNVVFSGSRSSLIALVISVGFLFIIKMKKIKYVVYIVVCSLMLIIIAIVNRIKNQLTATVSFLDFIDIITTYRDRVWFESIYLVCNLNFLFGCGVNTLYDNSWLYLGFESNIVHQGPYINNCHNLFVNIFYVSGFIALFFFLVICYKYIKNIFFKIKNGSSITTVSVVLCGFIISMLDVPLLYTSSYINIIWWFFLFYSISEA